MNNNIVLKKYKLLYEITLLFFCIYLYSFNNKYNIILLKNFIKNCNNLKRYNKDIKISKKNPFISICIPVYNMEKYIEKALLSIINQSFQDFEIILVNDNSNDDTEEIIRRLQKEFKKIKIINHNKNFGVYCSRVDASLNSNGKYILFMDPDDMFINPYLFEELFKYHLKYNLDMIEFTVYHNKEGEKKIFFPIFHYFNHYHNFKKAIIYQPELSKILFYIPNTLNYTSLICRTIWNKLIRKTILNFTLKYVENFFHNIYLITADDTALNLLNFHFANNYSNINIPGYLYNIRKNSMSRINNQKKHDIMVSYNYLLYFNFFYNYLKEFKKDLNILLYDLKLGFHVLFTFRKLNETKYIKKTINFFYKISKENISLNFKKFIKSSIFKIRQ